MTEKVNIINKDDVSAKYKLFRERGAQIEAVKPVTQAEEESTAYQRALNLATMYTEAELRMAVSMLASYVRSRPKKGGK